MNTPLKIIFAQGNPGTEYEKTRHNIGFQIIDSVASKHSLSWKRHPKAACLVADYTQAGTKVLLVKPLSFYNDTGLVARALIDFYKADASHSLLVLHDDLALPFGRIRIRHSGSDAGNNGIKSLNAHIGQLYARIRLGIWNEQREIMGDMAFVLGKFSRTEQASLLSHITPEALNLIDAYLSEILEDHSVTVTLS